MWTSADEYCEQNWKDYQKALKLIEQYISSPVEDIAFLCEYLKKEINNNKWYEEDNTKLFKEKNNLLFERDNYKYYSIELEKRLTLSPLVNNKENNISFIERAKAKYRIEN